MTADIAAPPGLRALDDEGWPAYIRALGALHAAREAAVHAHRAERRADAERAAELTGLARRLTEQQRALIDLAARLRAPVGAADLTPVTVRALAESSERGSVGLADLAARVEAAGAALAVARQVAVLPQLLPAWPSRFARAAVVYAGLAVPSLVLTVLLSLAGVGENRGVLLWFAVIWPLITAVAGSQVIDHVTRGRLAIEPTLDREHSGDLQQDRSAGERLPRYWWFGVLLAWASWLVPGALLDWLAALWPG